MPRRRTRRSDCDVHAHMESRVEIRMSDLVGGAGGVGGLATRALAAAQAAPQGEVTFTKDIAPILQRSCGDGK